MAESKINNERKWKLLDTVSASNTKNLGNLKALGYEEVYISANSYAGIMIPVIDIAANKNFLFGGYYNSSYGALFQIRFTINEDNITFVPNIAYLDSQNVMSGVTWNIYVK